MNEQTTLEQIPENSYFEQLRQKALNEKRLKEKEPLIKFLENLFPFTKGGEAGYYETLNYTPADTKDLVEKFQSKENRTLGGFQKTVTKKYEDFNGRGAGTLYLSDDNGKAKFNFYPAPPKEWIEKQNLINARSEFVANFFAHTAPVTTPFAMKTVPTNVVLKDSYGTNLKGTLPGSKGGQTLLQQRRSNNYLRRYKNEGSKIEWIKKNRPDLLNKSSEIAKSDIVNNVVNKSPVDVRAIIKIAKQNHISYKQAEAYLDLLKTGIRPDMTIKPGSSTDKRISTNPLSETSDITYASKDDIRNAEIALKVQGKTPSTENIYNYLNEYKTDQTIVPKKDWYNPKFKKTSAEDLFVYAKDPKDFKRFNTLEEARAEATADLLITRAGGKKWSGIEAEIGNPTYGEPTEFVKLYAKGASKDVLVLPYNKWHQQTKNPFKVPKDVANKLRKMEEGRQIDLIDDVPPTYIEKVTKKGNVVRKKARIKFPKGTVDKWIKYVDDEIAWQTHQQRVDEKFAKELYKKHGIEYKQGKTVFSRDKSHAVPRSEGGPGYTFLEAWWSNQQRGSKEILKPEILDQLGIPKTWEDYFWRWRQQEGVGEPVTDLGKLADIKWEDYERAMNGVNVNEIKLDRKTINHLIQRQIEDPTTFNQPGKLGATVGEDFEILVKRTKGLNPDDELLGEINPKEFDLRWRAANFEESINAKPDWLKERDLSNYKIRQKKWADKQMNKAKSESKKLRTRSRKQGQGDFDKQLQNLQLEEGIKKEIGVELISEKDFLDLLNKGEYKDFLNTIFPDRY